MRKGERTRARVVDEVAPLFNQRGFSGTSMSAIMDATGLEKGGLYRHFTGKDELALAAFDHAAALHLAPLQEALAAGDSPLARLRALLGAAERALLDPPVAGGCPLLNTAVDSADTHDALRERARLAVDRLRALVRRAVHQAVIAGELRGDADADDLSSLWVTTIEGAAVMARLCDEPTHVRRAFAHLARQVDRVARPAAPAT